MDIQKNQGGWFKRASKMMFYRRLPFAPLAIDNSYENSDMLMKGMQELEQLTEMASDKEAYVAALLAAKKAFLGNYEHDGQVSTPELPARSDHLERFVRVMHP